MVVQQHTKILLHSNRTGHYHLHHISLYSHYNFIIHNTSYFHNQVVHRSLVFALASDNKGKSQKMLEEVLAFQTTSEMVTKDTGCFF